MIDLITMIYFGYGLYFVGKNFPFGLDGFNWYENDDQLAGLFLAVIGVIMWPVFKGVAARKEESDEK